MRLVRRGLVTLAALLILPVILGAPFPARGARHPPPSHQAAEIETPVNRAAGELEQRGAGAFAAFRRRGEGWHYGDVYLFVVDVQGIVLFHAARPDREGRDLLDEWDTDGKRFHRDFVDVVRRFGSGWVDYMFPKPGQAAATVKWSDVCGTRVDGIAALVGAGV